MGESGRATPVDRDIEQAIVALKKGAHLLKYGRRGKPRFCPFRLSTLKDMAEKLPMKTQTSNGATVLSPRRNALNELLSPTNSGLPAVPEVEDIKYHDQKSYWSPTTRILKDVRVNGSCSPPLTHDTPMSAPGRAFSYQNASRSIDNIQFLGTETRENNGRLPKTENGRLPYAEWVEQDEPGVYITFMALPGGGKDLKRVRFR